MTAGATTVAADEPAVEETTSTSDWVLIAIEGLLVIGLIALGVRSGGVGLGLWGGVGTLILVFVFGLEPGEPPFDAMLIIMAVIAAAAAMQAAGGTDYMVDDREQGAPRATEARSTSSRPSSRTCSASSPGRATRSTRSSRSSTRSRTRTRSARNDRSAGSTVASALGITSSPVAAAMATLLPLVETYNYKLVDVLLITIPASIVGIFAMSS